MKVNFAIVRKQPYKETHTENYTVELEAGNTVLDGLNKIKWEQDGSLSFRKNCRNTICGSCAMVINGRPTLACKENIAGELERSPQGDGTITIAPMGNFPVIKDLIVDMKSFWDNLEEVEPYVSTSSRKVPEKEFLQTPEERAKLDQTGNCILCGACYSACNAKQVNPEFVGPHALAKAQRILADSRNDNQDERLENYNSSDQGVWGCTRCFMCNNSCPMGVNPMDQIGLIKQGILARNLPNQVQESRAIRHRRVLLDLVKEGGWIDERKFGFLVVTNWFRDLPGLVSIAPLALRLLTSGKFPFDFIPSEGTEEVRGLIDRVKDDRKYNAIFDDLD